MLVLTRQVDDEIVITDEQDRQIRITVVDVREGQVRVGIEAPPEFEIARSDYDE